MPLKGGSLLDFKCRMGLQGSDSCLIWPFTFVSFLLRYLLHIPYDLGWPHLMFSNEYLTEEKKKEERKKKEKREKQREKGIDFDLFFIFIFIFYIWKRTRDTYTSDKTCCINL